MTPKHASPEDVIRSWFTDRTRLDGRDAIDLVAHLHEAGWTFRRTNEVAVDRVDAEWIANHPENAPQAHVRAALEQQVGEPTPVSADESIQEANARWLSPHAHRGVPARLCTADGERDVIVRLNDENRAEWTPAVADSHEQGIHSYLFLFPVRVNTDSDILGAIQVLGSKLVKAGHRYELVNEPVTGAASADPVHGDEAT